MASKDNLISYLESQLQGPKSGEYEILDESPLACYATGILFSQQQMNNSEKSDPFGGDMNRGSETEEGVAVDEAVSMANQYNPSSLALSFFVRALDQPKEEISISVNAKAALYTRNDPEWKRQPLEDQSLILRKADANKKINCLNKNATLRTKWRKKDDGYVVTIALVNELIGKESEAENNLYQAGIEVQSQSGLISPYPSTSEIVTNQDDEELSIRYAHEKVYGVGHGCAVDWEFQESRGILLRSKFIPSYEVPNQDTVKEQSKPILKLTTLRDLPKSDLVTELNNFVDGYEEWYFDQKELAGEDTASLRIVKRIEDAIKRMRRGVSSLDQDDVLESFRLSQQAMIMQMEHSDKDLGGGRHNLENAPEMPEFGSYETSSKRWYPFQLAYIILCLPSVVNPEDEDRSEVDLIWASTGSGKTEAYLALAAISIIYRRITEKKHGGTSVITRYTLRLLTIQQFERTARLACALESLRRVNSSLRQDQITIGLWIGGSQTPNTFSRAVQWSKDIKRDPLGGKSFQLDTCPWCGTRIIPESSARPDEHFGFKATNESFSLNCVNPGCEFHRNLPIQVVDEALYKDPPTILIGTVDKFARLAWEEKAGIFFGSDSCLPPSLIIQDELHLLAGPLGTTTAIYEAGFAVLCKMKGPQPKILASTATIREADAQIQAIYGRNSNLFPPAGLDSRDSYFTRETYEKPGRTYVGILCPSLTAPTAKIWTSAILLQSNNEIEFDDAEEKDAYWTLVAYHNSKRELGASVTDGIDSIPGRLQFLSLSSDAEDRVLGQNQVMELSANIDSSLIPDALARLNSHMKDEKAVGFVPCTTMFSVGVDVQRLALMLVVGQPMQTSQYIQATSRVGRGKHPGIVITLFSPTKPRDRSHYENFRSYHGALYRWVEPTSVTPFSLASRERSLAAVFAILVRHGLGLNKNIDAKKFCSENLDVDKIVNLLCEQCEMSDPEETNNLRLNLRRLTDQWKDRAREDGELFYQEGNSGSDKTLLRSFGDRRGMWPALHSMRSVDVESRLRILDWMPDK